MFNGISQEEVANLPCLRSLEEVVLLALTGSKFREETSEVQAEVRAVDLALATHAVRPLTCPRIARTLINREDSTGKGLEAAEEEAVEKTLADAGATIETRT